MKREGLSRTRYLLPMEMLLYSVVAYMAVVAIVPRGVIHRLLKSWDMTTEWGVSFGLIGGIGFLLATTEWFFGVAWARRRLEISCRLRSLCAVAAVAAGGTCVAVCVRMNLIFLTGLGTFVVLFSLWSWWGNKRAAIFLSDKYDTRECEEEMGRKRAYF